MEIEQGVLQYILKTTLPFNTDVIYIENSLECLWIENFKNIQNHFLLFAIITLLRLQLSPAEL